MTRIILFCALALGLAACETTKGFGRDVEKAGDAITNAATDVQNGG